MDVTAIPFNKFIGLERAAPDSDFLVSLPGALHFTNHLNTVHAGALLAVAEAGSGAFLLKNLGDGTGYLPVVRRMDSKFKKPAKGRISARASVLPDQLERVKTDLSAKGRALITVSVEVVDESGVVALSSEIEWFIARI
jgi:acyl-coenzyme A thioesterase PaaI-like protein